MAPTAHNLLLILYLLFAEPADVRLPTITKGTRSKRHRSVKSYVFANGSDENDENDAHAANTPRVQPVTVKKLRIAGPTPHARSTAKKVLGSSAAKKEFNKSSIRKEIKPFALVSSQPLAKCSALVCILCI